MNTDTWSGITGKTLFWEVFIDNVALFFSNPDTRNLICLIWFIGSVFGGFILAKRLGLHQTSDATLVSTSNRFFPLALGTIVLLSACLRFYGLDFGLPTPYHPDELQKAHFLRSMIAERRINPNFNLQPPLLLYLSWLFAQVLKLFHIFDGDSISRLLLAGRSVNAICGTLSVLLLYFIGARLSSRHVGLFAASLLAVFPLHVTNSRYMKEDSLFIFFVLSCLLFVLKSVDEKKLRYLYLSGLFAGFALGSKYTGIVCFFIVLAAPFLRGERFSFIPDWRLLRHALLAILLEPVGFVLAAPYLLESWENIQLVIEGFGSESRHAMRGHMGVAISANSQLWMFHLRNSLIPGIGFPGMFVALIGIGTLLYRWRPKGLFLIALALLFYLPAEWANSKPPPQPDRYVLACTPFLALIVSDFIQSLFLCFGATPTVKRGMLFLMCLIFGLPTFRTIRLASEIRYDTRREMSDWMYENLPAGSRILLSGGTTYLPRIPQKFQGVALRKALGRANEHFIDRLKAANYDYILLTSLTAGRFATTVGGRAREATETLKEIHRTFKLVKQISARSGPYGFHNPVLSLYSLKDTEPSARAQSEANELSNRPSQ